MVNFKVMKDGAISDLKYEKRSGDDALDSAAYDGVASSAPLPALPTDFGCKFVALHIHFIYNPKPGEPARDRERTSTRIPCVTTTIHFIREVGIALSPDSGNLVAGGKQQFLATLIGVENPVIVWKISGPGCAGGACGEISTDGIYRAPSNIPSPPTITITAALKSESEENASATITIVPGK